MAQYMRGNETVFETPDVEKDAHPVNIATTSMTADGARDATESIDAAHIEAGRSFEVFQGKVFTLPANVLSVADSIERRVESPLQRFVRLRQELADLKSDLDIMNSDVSTKDSSMWAVLQSEAGNMLTDLHGLEAHPVLVKRGAATSHLTSELREVVAKPVTATEAAPKPIAPVEPTDGSAALEQRIFTLETLLGSSSNVIDMEGAFDGKATESTDIFPLVDAIARMEKRVSMLSEEAIDRLRAASATLRAELEATNREKNKNVGPEQKVIEAVAKLDDLYKKIQLADGVSHDLPALIVRLKTLQRLHGETAGFSARVASLESATDALLAQTNSNTQVLQDVKEGLSSNISTMISNIEQMDQRIAQLKK